MSEPLLDLLYILIRYPGAVLGLLCAWIWWTWLADRFTHRFRP